MGERTPQVHRVRRRGVRGGHGAALGREAADGDPAGEGIARGHQDRGEDTIGGRDKREVGLDDHRRGEGLAGAHRLALGHEPLLEQGLGIGFGVRPELVGEDHGDHAAAFTGAPPRTSARAAAAILSTCGMTNCSRGRL